MPHEHPPDKSGPGLLDRYAGLLGVSADALRAYAKTLNDRDDWRRKMAAAECAAAAAEAERPPPAPAVEVVIRNERLTPAQVRQVQDVVRDVLAADLPGALAVLSEDNNG